LRNLVVSIEAAEASARSVKQETDDCNLRIESGTEALSSLEKNRKQIEGRLAAAEAEVAKLSGLLEGARMRSAIAADVCCVTMQ
jgi:hypothetical protein